MKKLIFISMVMIATMVACKKTSTSTSYTKDCSGSNKSYKADVSPILTSSCNSGSGCHASGSNSGPGALNTYTSVYGSRSSISSSVTSGRMPQGSTLTSAQKNAILCWIDQGAANN